MRIPVFLCLLCVLCASLLSCCSCGKAAHDADVASLVDDFFKYLKARDYDKLYQLKAAEFKESDPKARFVMDMKELEKFGSVVSFFQDGAVELSRESGGRIARVTYLATFALGEGTFRFKLGEDTRGGRWEMLGLEYKMSRKIRMGPYPSDNTGMVRLLSNFFYMWQTRQYDKLTRDLGLLKEESNFGRYLKNLESAGDLRDFSLKSANPGKYLSRKAVQVVLETEFTHMAGPMTFKLVEVDGLWKIYSIHFDLHRK